MKINNFNHINAIKGYEQMKKPADKTKDPGMKKDSLEVSEAYTTYEKAIQTLKGMKDTGMTEKIEALKEQIAKGEYKVNSKELADIIVNKAKEQKNK